MLTGLNHITLSVADIERSFGFYVDVLGCRPRARWNSGAYLSIGDLWLCLSLDQATHNAVPDEYTHIAFSVSETDFEVMREHLQQHHARFWKDNISEGDSIYLLDPDHHKLELHVGDLQSRLDSLKLHPYDGLQLFAE